MEEPPFEEEFVEENEYKEELVFHNELVDEKYVQAHQQMYFTTLKNANNNKTHQRSDTKSSASSWIRVNEFDKRKKMVLDKLGIQL